MDITKYLKNKDIKIKEDDFDIDTLTSDLTAGLYSEKDYKKGIADKEKEISDRFTKDLADKDNAIASLTKTSDATNGKLKGISFENSAFKKGFKAEDMERASRLRATYTDVTDDEEALTKLSEEYKDIFFKDVKPIVPNEAPISGKGTVEPPKEIKFGTTVRDLLKK